jgi:hypothetical protein
MKDSGRACVMGACANARTRRENQVNDIQKFSAKRLAKRYEGLL